jgi:hypothetical protein
MKQKPKEHYKGSKNETKIWFSEKIRLIKPLLARLAKRHRRFKSIKLDMKILQQIPLKSRGSLENALRN